MKILLLCAILAALSLCGCAGTVTQTPAAIEIDGFGLTAQEIADKAEAHCQQYGSHARIKAADRRLLGSYQAFDCVKV